MTGFFVFVLFCTCAVLVLRLRGTRRDMEELSNRIGCLEDELRWGSLSRRAPEKEKETVAPTVATPPPLPSHLLSSQSARRPQPAPAPAPAISTSPRPIAVPPLLTARETEAPPAPTPSPARSQVPPSVTPAEPKPEFQWENFLGAKLFAWIAGVAVFLAVVFFVKYAFERNLISPQLRVGIGYVVGLALVAGGLRVPRPRYAILAQTFCATGILVLYANTFAAHSFYDFFSTPLTFALMTVFTAAAFFLAVRLDGQVIAVLGLLGGFLTPPLLSTGVDRALGLFGYITLLDAGLIIIALRKRWQYLVLLGAAATALMQWAWVGRFFEPAKLSTGMGIFLGFTALFTGAYVAARRKELADGWLSAAALIPVAMAMLFGLYLVVAQRAEATASLGVFFGYVLLANLACGALAWLDRRWNPLLLFAAIATALIQWIWVGRFFTPEKVHAVMGMFLGFSAVFLGLFAWAQRRGRVDGWLSTAVVFMAAMAQGFALFLVGKPYAAIATNTPLFFGYVFLANLPFLVLAWLREQLQPTHVVAGLGVFALLTVWTMQFLTAATLNVALAAYLVFALLHTLFPLVLQRLRPVAMPLTWGHLFPPLALLLVLFPLGKLATTSLLVWPVVLLIDLTAIVMAVLTASLMSILIVFVLTVVATALWIFELPPTVTEVPGMLTVIGGFAIFFMAAAVFAAKKVFARLPASGEPGGALLLTKESFGQICALAAMLPFLLLTMVVLRLPLANPASVFGLAALLVVLMLGLARKFGLELLTLVGLVAVLVLEYTWHFERFTSTQVWHALPWYLGFSALFLVFPFLFQKHFAARGAPWAAAALALPAHFLILHRAFKAAAPEFPLPGLLPAALALPCLAGLLLLVKTRIADSRESQSQLALFGAATLFFVTLIFPIQFDRQWITVGWALEGAALLWLFHRVPHPGLRVVGVALLVAGFVRLALNPWVFTAYGRTGTPLLNWYLYAFGIVAACLFIGARLLAPPRDRMQGVRVTPLLYALGTVLAFMLLNIEIADAFSPPGGPLVFHFSADFGQDMTYSIAWAVFAFALLAAGFAARNAPTRYAGMALLFITLLKLFLHDIWRLGGLYRIGSLIGLAVVLLVVSMLYQRFLAAEKESKETAAPLP